MPAPLRFCSTPRCGNLVTIGRCATCRRARELARGSAHTRGYDATWRAYSRRWLQLHRWCGERQDFHLYAEHSRCVQQGLQTRATVTDHIVSMRRGGEKFDGANHQSLCASCNTHKSITLEGATGARSSLM